MKRVFATALITLSIAMVGQAQQPGEESKCATYTELQKVFQMFPEQQELYNAQELLENSRVGTTVNADGKKVAQYVIPVVFHILHEYGNENIDDSQVYDLMTVLNREFNANDPDSVDLVAEYQNLHGDGQIEFRLAALDPFGNCTNGIEHIYTHETNFGDAFSKVNQWNRARYLNVWVVDIVGTPGAAAYATPPASTDGSGFWLDGVLSRWTYIGEIPGAESVITHEVGHYLNLKHVWGDLDLINNPPSICGDDGVPDTPMTMGWLAPCPMGIYPNGWIVCDTANNVVEDVQNYMEYSYCDRHFTPGQVVRMHNALNGLPGQRNQLWQDSTLVNTGVKDLQMPQVPTNDVNNLTVPLCTPVADFHTADRTLCIGGFAQFEDASWNAVIGSRQWTFEGGSPATSTSANPVVSWNTAGWKKVTLKVTNAAGSDTKEIDDYIYVSNDWADYTGPVLMNLEGNSHWYFKNFNYEWNHGEFKVVDGYGYDQSRCFKLTTYKDISQADPYTADGFYNNRLGGSIDDLITASVNLSNTSNVTLKFKYAYATNATNPADITERLKVYSSKNCGETWQTLSTITGVNLVTAGFAGNQDFNPTSNTMWGEKVINYAASATDTKTRFKIEFEASDVSSNLFIDNVEITGILGVEDQTIMNMQLTVFPNPSNGEAINVEYYAQDEPTRFTLRDVQGKIIAEQVIDLTHSFVNTTIDGTDNLPAACYFLEVTTGDHSVTKKVVVL